MSQSNVRFASTVFVLLLVPALVPASVGAENARDVPRSDLEVHYPFLGAGSQPLPFSSEEQVLDFLRQAPVVAKKRLGEGINRPFKVTLQMQGVRANAVFRTVEERLHRSPTGARHLVFRDSFRFEVAAYRLSRLLDLDNVPPTVLRTLDGVDGSLQLWVEGATSEARRRRKGLERIEPERWYLETQSMAVFDNLIYNFDRNAGNILFDDGGKVWMVDHTRSFKNLGMLRSPAQISLVERNLWQRLKALDPEEVREELRPYLDPLALQTLLSRHQKLIRFIDGLIEERGPARVLFDLPPALG